MRCDLQNKWIRPRGRALLLLLVLACAGKPEARALEYPAWTTTSCPTYDAVREVMRVDRLRGSPR